MKNYENVIKFLSFLNVSETDALKALLSAFVPIQPGALTGTWKNRKGYDENVPTASEFWSLFKRADFRCEECSSQFRITVDHKNKDSQDHSSENLRVLCVTCNRASSSRPIKCRDANVKLYLAAMEILGEQGKLPDKNPEIVARAIVEQASGSMYMLRFLRHRIAQAKGGKSSPKSS